MVSSARFQARRSLFHRRKATTRPGQAARSTAAFRALVAGIASALVITNRSKGNDAVSEPSILNNGRREVAFFSEASFVREASFWTISGRSCFALRCRLLWKNSKGTDPLMTGTLYAQGTILETGNKSKKCILRRESQEGFIQRFLGCGLVRRKRIFRVSLSRVDSRQRVAVPKKSPRPDAVFSRSASVRVCRPVAPTL